MNTNKLLLLAIIVCILIYGIISYMYYRYLLRNRLPPRFVAFLKKYGDYSITDIQLCQVEISERVRNIFYGLSYGKLRPVYLQKGPIMHPYLLLTIQKNGEKHTVLFEKNEVIVLRIPKPENLKKLINNDYVECIGVVKGIQGLTLNAFITETIGKLKERFIRYHCTQDNCQLFLYNILLGENMIPSEKQEEIKMFLNPNKIRSALRDFDITVRVVNILQEILGVKEFIFNTYNKS